MQLSPHEGREPESREGCGGGAALFEWGMLVYLARVLQVCARSLHCAPPETGHRSMPKKLGCGSVRVKDQREGPVPAMRPCLRKHGDRPTAFSTAVAVGVHNSTCLFVAGASVSIAECCRDDIANAGVLHLDTSRNCRRWVGRVGPILLSWSLRVGCHLSGLGRRTRPCACTLRVGGRRWGAPVFVWCGRRRRGGV